jgi:hypothetical protein
MNYRILIRTARLLAGPFCVIATIHLLSCFNIDENDNYGYEEYVPHTAVSAQHHNKKQKQEKSASITLFDFEDFKVYKQSCKLESNDFERITYVDTTGDGQLEKVKISLTLTETGCYVNNTISKAGKEIWNDELLIDHAYGATAFGSWLNYVEHYPISSLYLGSLFSNFMDELDPRQHNYDLRKKTLLRQVLGPNPSAQALTALYNSELAKSMDNYKGKYVFQLGLGKRTIHMWDAEAAKFVPVFHS